MLKRARKTHPAQVAAGRLALHEAGMESMPIDDGALDGWISLNTVYFVEDLPPALPRRASAECLHPWAAESWGSPTRNGWHSRRSPSTH